MLEEEVQGVLLSTNTAVLISINKVKITMHQENNDMFHLPRDMSTTGCSTIPQVILSVGFSRIFDAW